MKKKSHRQIAYWLFLSAFFGEWLVVAEMGPQNAQDVPTKSAQLQNEYLDQKKPGMIPEVFAAGIISTPAYEHGAPAFSADGKELYWSVFYEKEFKQKIFFTRLENGGWSKPAPMPFTNEKYIDGNPVFSGDGKRIYFTSNRPLTGNGVSRDKVLWVWFVERKINGWTEPLPLKAVFDQVGLMAAPSFDQKGTMYFTPWKGEGLVSGNIYFSKLLNGVYQQPVRMGLEVNAEDYQAYAFVPPDGSFMIFEAQRSDSFGGDDLYVSFRKKDGGWSKAMNMGKAINTKDSERCPTVTSDGKYIFFISNRTGNYDYYWVEAKILKELKPE